MKSVFIVITFFFASLTAMSQSANFEGEIHFVTTYTYFPAQYETFKNDMPVTMDIYIRNHLICQEGPTALKNGYQIHIRNLQTNSGYTALRVADNAVAYRKMSADYVNEDASRPTPTNIEYLNETRTIAGFVAKKALVYMPNSTKPFVVYYSEQIPSEGYVIYKGLRGFPLYFEGNLNGVTYYSEAKSINPTPQEDSKFLLPKQFRVVSYEEFKSTLIKDIQE